MSENNKSVFDVLNKIDVSDKVEIKDTGKVKLSYLSWAWAWAETKKLYPNVKVEVHENNEMLPYFVSDEGIMVKVSVDINDISHTVYLPVMDGANNAMKDIEYTFKTRFGEKEVKAATMMDINKTIQRATVKAIALHGLGLYIYAGEDLPEGDEKAEKESKSPVKKVEATKNINTNENVELQNDEKVIKKSGNSFRNSVKKAVVIQEEEL